MESCTAYRPWFDKAKGQALLKPTSGKCLHYYFYFIDEDFGLCYVRVPTWAPFRLQVYFNGHSWLAQQLRGAGIDFAMADNAFLQIADPLRAQQLAKTLDAHTLHQHLDRWAARFCPVVGHFRGGYHWSFMQVEYATDVVFRQQAVFQPLYQAIVRTAVHVGACRACGDVPRPQAQRPLPGRARQRLLHPYSRHPYPPSHGSRQSQAL